MSKTGSSLRKNYQRPNETVLTPAGGHDIRQRSTLPVTGRGTVFRQGSNPREEKVLTFQQPPHPENLPDGGLPETPASHGRAAARPAAAACTASASTAVITAAP